MPTPLRASLAVALGLSLASTLPVAAEQASFDFTIAGIRVGTLTMSSKQESGAYTAASRIDTAGIIGMFADFFFDGKATGTVVGGRTVVPGRYDATSQSPRALRHTAIDWKDGTPVSVSVKPPRSSAPDPAKQGGTLDPVSAGFRLFRSSPPGEVCDTRVVVFDGSRLSELKLGKPAASGDGLACDGTFARIEGEAHSMAERNEFPFRIQFSLNREGRAELERIEAPTNFGQAVIARRG